MCVTINPAELQNTILLAHSVMHEGHIVNVLGYQNMAKNRSQDPNAMILPFPAAAPMSQENCLDLSAYPGLFRRYAELVTPVTRGGSLGSYKFSAQVQIFDSGSYTVVLASDATAIPEALGRVPERRRPRLRPELFDAYNRWYPGWSIALCCWDGTIEAEPLLWWYEPMPKYQDCHFLPGLDGHDGGIPDPSQSVSVDHTIVIGSHTTGSLGPTAGKVRDSVASPEIRRFLPDHVYGGVLKHQMTNGDWVLPKEGWTRHSAYDRIAVRAPPPGF